MGNPGLEARRRAKAPQRPSKAQNDTRATETGKGVPQGPAEEVSREDLEARRQAWLRDLRLMAQENTEMGNGVHQGPAEDVSREDLEAAGKHDSGDIRLSTVPEPPESPC